MYSCVWGSPQACQWVWSKTPPLACDAAMPRACSPGLLWSRGPSLWARCGRAVCLCWTLTSDFWEKLTNSAKCSLLLGRQCRSCCAGCRVACSAAATVVSSQPGTELQVPGCPPGRSSRGGDSGFRSDHTALFRACLWAGRLESTFPIFSIIPQAPQYFCDKFLYC